MLLILFVRGRERERRVRENVPEKLPGKRIYQRQEMKRECALWPIL